ncbi:DUF1853 family protein [Winogradskyella sp. UBA3174]|uniref:DUF1853 family protein n=1 Tax=Winogradskyella sp. UBA3174 TaxID=1947785 RepID=UPI0025E25EF3|nr:DUF1853 family protein [Winogradskyella sp. UBA3174]|tara:strand:- start:7905 stop:8714 length:810 start_codon:yes stop_codon:yes gene_type:complete
MDLNTILRYKGCFETPSLWKRDTVYELNQLDLDFEPNFDITKLTLKNHRLGKQVEAFINHQLKQQDSIHWICDNLQIQNDKITIGELDALFYKDNTPIHLEIVYKFYLYDNSVIDDNPLKKWIGPNRKDALVYKLDKLRNKQLPLLYNTKTKLYLDKFNHKATDFEQYVCFKAQLFLPYKIADLKIHPININCVNGFYLSIQKIDIINYFEFYIPNKLDWLFTPHIEVSWLKFKEAKIEINKYIIEKHSPLCWLKDNDEKLQKCFITWW